MLLLELVGGDATLTGVAADVFTYDASSSTCAKLNGRDATT